MQATPLGFIAKFRALVSKFPNHSSRVSATIMDATMGSLSPFFVWR